MTLAEIYIYPIKSLKGIRVEKAYVEGRGLQYDRRMMLVDQNNQFLSQRKFPELALFSCMIKNDSLNVEYNGEKITIPLKHNDSGREEVTIWNDNVSVSTANYQINEWFTDQLKYNCRLAIMDSQSKRRIPEQYQVKDNEVSFADGFPLLLVNTASMDDLNAKSNSSIHVSRFRPNLVLKTNEAFLEDSLNEFILGDVRFQAVKPCARCTMITIDQSSGQKSNEPLNVLSKYRKKNNKVFFGQNLINLCNGWVAEGDRLEIISNKKQILSFDL